jgi:DNA-binding LacI/PurR family transcriptional regulator
MNGGTASGARQPTMEDVAARAGVSRALVSIVFRNQPGASDATRRRVRDAASKLGYAPDQRARLLGRKRSGQLGVAFGLQHGFHGELVEAMYAPAEHAGYELVLTGFAPSRSEGRAIDDLLAYRCEAVIVVGPTMRTRDLVALSRQVPTVVLARPVAGGAVDVVRTDDVDGARQATEHLMAQGHHRILHIDGGRAPGAAERRRGYRQAMAAAGLDPMPFVSGGLTEIDGARAGNMVAAMLRRRRDKLSAVFAFNDQCALGLLQVIRAASFTVPDDLAVVGYDDSRVARLPWVELTTIGQDVQELARKAVDQAIARTYHPADRRETIVSPELVVRSTSAATESRRR